LAIRALGGSTGKPEAARPSQMETVHAKEKEPRLAAVVSKLAAIRKLYESNVIRGDSFVSWSYKANIL